MKGLTVVSGNKNKIAQMERILGVSLESAELELEEIQSLDLATIIEAKARTAYATLGTPVIVDDASLGINQLGGLPGPFVRWFIEAVGAEGICRFADQSPTRSATAEVAIGLFDGKEFHSFIEAVQGTIAEHPQGEQGFGWDSVFIHEGTDKTRAEMDHDERDRVYPIRASALNQLRDYLAKRG